MRPSLTASASRTGADEAGAHRGDPNLGVPMIVKWDSMERSNIPQVIASRISGFALFMSSKFPVSSSHWQTVLCREGILRYQLLLQEQLMEDWACH